MLKVHFVIIFILINSIVFAQEKEYNVYASVDSISAKQIIISEYDIEKKEFNPAIFSIGPKVKLENVNSLDEIFSPMFVDITYVIREAKKVALRITVDPRDLGNSNPEKTIDSIETMLDSSMEGEHLFKDGEKGKEE